MSAFCCNKPLVTYEKEVDVERFMGDWYVVGVIPTPFEINAYNPVERYTWNKDKNWVDVDFQFNKGSLDGKVSSVPQCLIVSGYPQAKGGSWTAKPYKLPFIGLDYIIMDLSEDYSWTVIGHPSRKWLWIMSRTTTMDKATYLKAVEFSKENGFDVEKIINPEHNPVA